MNQTMERPPASAGRAAGSGPLVSVVVVCYNQARYLGDALASVLGQTWGDLEVVVVDDGSADDTAAVVRRFPEARYVHQPNRGLAAARNTGLRHTTGQYVLFLDADDRLLPRAVEAGLDCFRAQPECGFVFGAYRNIRSDGSPAATDPPEPVDQDHYWRLLQGNVIGMHGAVLYKREALEAAGGFDETLRACEDYDLYLRLARKWPVRRHLEVAAEYRQHDDNMSRDRAFMLRSVLQVLRREQGRVPDRRHRRALRRGKRVWREYYGRFLVEEWKANRTWAGWWRLFRLDPRGMLERSLKAVLRRMWRRAAMPRVRFGSLRRLEPFSRRFGLDRGQPVDRYYIESFLAGHAAAVQGRVLEIGDDAYSRRFGGDRVTWQDVLHVAPGYPGATIIADLARAPQIRSECFDCIILTQTLHYIYDVHAAAATLARILKPGGTLLATLPGISQVCRDQQDRESDCWRFTAASARRLVHEHFPGAACEVRTYGNVLAAAAFLYGLAASDLRRRELDHHDPDYPVTVAVAVTKAAR